MPFEDRMIEDNRFRPSIIFVLAPVRRVHACRPLAHLGRLVRCASALHSTPDKGSESQAECQDFSSACNLRGQSVHQWAKFSRSIVLLLVTPTLLQGSKGVATTQRGGQHILTLDCTKPTCTKTGQVKSYPAFIEMSVRPRSKRAWHLSLRYLDERFARLHHAVDLPPFIRALTLQKDALEIVFELWQDPMCRLCSIEGAVVRLQHVARSSTSTSTVP